MASGDRCGLVEQGAVGPDRRVTPWRAPRRPRTGVDGTAIVGKARLDPLEAMDGRALSGERSQHARPCGHPGLLVGRRQQGEAVTTQGQCGRRRPRRPVDDHAGPAVTAIGQKRELHQTHAVEDPAARPRRRRRDAIVDRRGDRRRHRRSRPSPCNARPRCPRPGPGASWVRPSGPASDHRATSGSHCSVVRPRIGQKATATPQPTPATATTSPPSDGLGPQQQHGEDEDAATAAIWPPRQPAMIPAARVA